jgi:2-keto-4-pentenoate hydratase
LSGGDVSPSEAYAAVERISASFEINELRVDQNGPVELQVGDDIGQWGIVIGSGQSQIPRSHADIGAQVFFNGSLISESSPGETMDDPLLALTRICATLNRFGLGLKAGQNIITGAFSHHELDAPGTWRAVFSGVGEVVIVVD